MIKNKRFASIEALRFFFILQICIWHFGSSMTAGFLGVEFFFILAGVFIYINLQSNSHNDSTIEYIYKKVKKFYLEYIIALILAYIVSHSLVIENISNNGVGGEFMRFISQLLLIQNISPFPGGYNTPTWFFSILIWGSAFVYALTKDYSKISIRLIFPIALILFLSYAYNSVYGEGLEQWGIRGILPITLVRGFVEIGFGVIVGYVYTNYIKRINISRWIVNLITVISIILYILIVFSNNKITQYSFIFIPVIIIAGLMEDSFISKLFNGKIWLILGQLSFPMFLIHISIIKVINHILWIFNLTYPRGGYLYIITLIIYIITLIISSYLFMAFCNYIKMRLCRNQKVIS